MTRQTHGIEMCPEPLDQPPSDGQHSALRLSYEVGYGFSLREQAALLLFSTLAIGATAATVASGLSVHGYGPLLPGFSPRPRPRPGKGNIGGGLPTQGYGTSTQGNQNSGWTDGGSANHVYPGGRKWVPPRPTPKT